MVGPPLITQGSLSNKDTIKVSENGVRKRGIITRENIQFSCYEITEPELDPNAIAEKDEHIASVLATFQKSLEKNKLNIGYATTVVVDYSAMGELLPNYVLNNFGDPFIKPNYIGQSREFEVGVLDWFARLWELEKDEYWGYVTSGGSEGNLHAILLGREIFPDGIFYTSKESHFSVFKAARMYRMECVVIDTLISGEIDCAHLKAMLLLNKDKPAIINVTIGTTMKGAIDDVDLVIKTLEECGFSEDRFYVHCDGAMYGFMLPLLQGVSPKITFKKPIRSVSISGHKFIGTPMPCGIQMTRIKHIKAISREIEYIATRDATIPCSRNGHTPIFLWYALNRKGYRGFKEDFEKCLTYAKYFKKLLKEAGISVTLNEISSTVVFERPHDQDLIRCWQLSCEGDLTHVVVMPDVTIEKLDSFYKELIESRSNWLRLGNQPKCIAHDIGSDNCPCAKHKDS